MMKEPAILVDHNRQPATLLASSALQHAAVHPLTDHTTHHDGFQATSLVGDFSQVRAQTEPSVCTITPTRCLFGGACHTCPVPMQTKLVVSQPGDTYEREADRVAEEAMHTGEVQLQRRAVNHSAQHLVPSSVREVLRSPGKPLDAASRTFMESRFRHDFSQVRVHTDAKAAESVRAVNALAYTVKRDIVFGAGQYSPGTMASRQLLAHELTHVLQQTRSSGTIFPSVQHIQRNSRQEEERSPHPKPEGGKPASKSEQWDWWGLDCQPAPKGVSAEQLLDRVKDLIKGARALGLNLAADNLESYLLGKKPRVDLPTKLLATNPLVVSHLGPDSNPQPSAEVIRSTMGEKKGIENLVGEHHVVFLGGALKRLENGAVKFGQSFNMPYEDSISFYTQGGGQYPDLAYGIAGCTVHSDVTVETAREDGEVLMHYMSWQSWIDDTYNFDKGKVALFPIGFCIPDSDLVRLQAAGYAKDFHMSTAKWSNPSKWLALWFPLPYRPPSQAK